MSQLTAFMDRAGRISARIMGTVPVKCGAVTRSCVPGSVQVTKAVRDSGRWQEIDGTLDFSREDFAALHIDVRSVLLIVGERRQVVMIENDPLDPRVLVHVAAYRGK